MIYLPENTWEFVKGFQLDYQQKHKRKLTKVLNQFAKGCYDRRRPTRIYEKGYNVLHTDLKYGHHCMSDNPVNLEYLMSSWVDGLYSEPWGWLSPMVHMEGRYIKPVNNYEYLAVRPDLDMLTYFDIGRINHQEGIEDKISRGEDSWKHDVYSITYHSNARDWRNRDPHWGVKLKEGAHFIPDGIREWRLEQGLPLYEDKAMYTMKLDSRRFPYANVPPIVKMILKNIKKWEKYNPQLCDY
jgi:hypothetical protein